MKVFIIIYNCLVCRNVSKFDLLKFSKTVNDNLLSRFIKVSDFPRPVLSKVNLRFPMSDRKNRAIEVFNWSEVPLYRSNYLQYPYFKWNWEIFSLWISQIYVGAKVKFPWFWFDVRKGIEVHTTSSCYLSNKITLDSLLKIICDCYDYNNKLCQYSL